MHTTTTHTHSYIAGLSDQAAHTLANSLLALQSRFAAGYLAAELGNGLQSDSTFDYAGSCLDVMQSLLYLAYEGSVQDLADFLAGPPTDTYGSGTVGGCLCQHAADGLCPELQAYHDANPASL